MVAVMERRQTTPPKVKKAKKPPGQWETMLADAKIRGNLISVCGSAYIIQKEKSLKIDRRNLMRSVPSMSWFDSAWFEGVAWPPGGDRSLMRACCICRRKTPPNYLTSRGACEDCVYCSMSSYALSQLPGSSSAINLAKLKASARYGRSYGGGF